MSRFNQRRGQKPSHAAGLGEKKRIPLLAILLIVLGALVYANTFQAPFVFDDAPNITRNPHIRMSRLTLPQVEKILKSPSSHRPVANFTFAVNYYLHRYRVFGYHVFNLVIHLINGLLVLFLAQTTLRHLGCDRLLPPFLAAALWLVNPVHIQSVTYVVQRMTSLAAMFYLLSLFLYIQARTASKTGRWQGFLLFAMCAVSGLLALGSKEIAATLPIMILLYEWFFLQDLNTSFLKRHIQWLVIALFTGALIALVFLGKAPLETILTKYEEQPFSLGQRLLTEPRVICHYLLLLVLPLPGLLNITHYVSVSTALTAPPTTILAMIFLVFLAAAAIMTARTHRLFAFAVFWFLGTLMIESSVIGLELMFEHRTYLPSIFLFIAAGAGLSRIRPRWLAAGTLVALIAVSAIWTWQRNSHWQNKIDFWQNAIKKDPRCVRPHNNLGIALAEAGRYREGIAACQQSIALSPPTLSTARPYNNIGIMYSQLGKDDLAMEYCQRATRIEPEFAEPYMNLGKIMIDQKRPDRAVSYLKKATSLNPHLMPAYLQLAEALYNKTDDPKKAIRVCRNALTFQPDFVEARRLIGSLLMAAGQPDKALLHFQAVLRVRPDHQAAYLNAGIACDRLGKHQKAVSYLKKAVSLKPSSGRAHFELSSVLTASGKAAQAEKHFLKYLDLAGQDPGLADKPIQIEEKQLSPGKASQYYQQGRSAIPDTPRCLNQLAMMLTRRHQYDHAEEIMKELLRKLPQAPTVEYNLACLYARQNQTKKALAHLKKAVEKGFSDVEALRRDADLEKLRHTAGYRALMEKLH